MTRSDRDLMGAIGEGDERAFAELYDRFAARLLGLIVRILGRRAEAEDVLQEVLREVWCTSSRYRPERGSVAFWLMMLARSRAIDALRRRAARPASAVSDAQTVRDDAAPPPHDRELVDRARRALARLPEEQRDAIGLAFFSGRTGSQIADVQGVPLGTVKTRIRLGMIKLREYLEIHEVSRP